MEFLYGTSIPSEGLDGDCAPSTQTETADTQTFTTPAPAPAINVDGAVKSNKRARSNSVAPSSTSPSSKRQRLSPPVESEEDLDGYVVANGPIPELIYDTNLSQGPFLLHEHEAVPDDKNESESLDPNLLHNTPHLVDLENEFQQVETREVIDLDLNENDQPSEPPKKRTKRKRVAESSAELDEAKPEPKKRKFAATGTRTLVKAWENYGEAVEKNMSTLQSVLEKEYGITVDLPALPFRPTNGLQVLEEQNNYSVTLEKDYNVKQENNYNALQNQYEQLESFTGGMQESLMTMGTIERYLVKLLKRKSHIVDAICEKLGVEVPGDLTVPEPMQNPDTTSPADSGVDIHTPKIVETVETAETIEPIAPIAPTENNTPAPPSEEFPVLEAAQYDNIAFHGDDSYAFMQGIPAGGVETHTTTWDTGYPDQVMFPLAQPQLNNTLVDVAQPFGGLEQVSDYTYPVPALQHPNNNFLQSQVPRENHSVSVDSMTQSLPSSGIHPANIQHHEFDFLDNEETSMNPTGFDPFLNNNQFIDMPGPPTFDDSNKENGDAIWFTGDQALDDGNFYGAIPETRGWDDTEWTNFFDSQNYMVTPGHNDNGVYNNSVYNNSVYNNTVYNNGADNNDHAYN